MRFFGKTRNPKESCKQLSINNLVATGFCLQGYREEGMPLPDTYIRHTSCHMV